MNSWDVALLLAVSLQCAVISYVSHPRWKALLFGLPVPFTLITLALGRDVDASNVLGLVVLLIYAHCVRLLHHKVKLPIVPSIIISALVYCAVGLGLLQVLPRGELGFWLSAAFVFSLATALFIFLPHKREPHHRTPLPIHIKLPIIMFVIFFVIAMKHVLLGFMTVFPMVGVVTAYESRHSLWTFSRQVPVIMMTLSPMMMTCRLLQDVIGLGPALAVSWVVFIAAITFFTRWSWRSADRRSDEDAPMPVQEV